MDEAEVMEQVQQLRQALMNAQERLVEQDTLLAKLTSPPFAYATVVAATRKGPENFEHTFTALNGGLVEIDAAISSLEGFTIGDELKLRDGTTVRREVQRSKKFTVVGFTSVGLVVVQLENGTVVADHPALVADIFRVIDHKGETERIATAVVALDGKLLEVIFPEDKNVQPGDAVKLNMETHQIVDLASVQVGGSIGFVRRTIDPTFSEVDYESSTRVVFNGKPGIPLEKGDRVVLDGTGMVIVRNLGKEDSRFRFAAETSVTWDDIGGLQTAKEQMIEAVELPHQHPEIYKYWGKKPVKGILLYGPPRCGKTMLGKAVATALARIYKGSADSSGFMYVKGPEILDRYIGVAEATIRSIFERARHHKSVHGYPAVVFIDEADAILYKRGTGVSSDIERTIVPMFLTEMDGLEDSGALVILATNRADVLDPAVVGDGRIDRKIKIDRPSIQSTADIFLLNLKDVPLSKGCQREELAKLGSEELFAPSRMLYRIVTKNGELGFTLGHIVNGGMVVNVVDQATSLALHRDLSKKKPEGLRKDDLVTAVSLIEEQNRDLNHNDDLKEFVYDFREDVLSIERLHRSNA